jgi:hypothetical protein
MNGAGECWPAKETIRAGASLASVRATDQAVNRIEAAGFLIVGRTKGRSSNHYTAVTPHDRAGSTPYAGAELTPHDQAGFRRSNPASDDTQPRTTKHPTLHADAGESAESAESGASALSLEERDAALAGMATLRAATGL